MPTIKIVEIIGVIQG